MHLSPIIMTMLIYDDDISDGVLGDGHEKEI